MCMNVCMRVRVRALCGARVTCQDGVTPLMVACGEGDEACVRLLLDRGADATLRARVRPPHAHHAL